MHRYIAYYHAPDGSADYNFSFEEQLDGTWRVYIEGLPSYGSFATDTYLSHRHSHSDGSRKYISWTSDLQTLNEAKQIALLWASETQKYIRGAISVPD